MNAYMKLYYCLNSAYSERFMKRDLLFLGNKTHFYCSGNPILLFKRKCHDPRIHCCKD